MQNKIQKICFFKNGYIRAYGNCNIHTPYIAWLLVWRRLRAGGDEYNVPPIVKPIIQVMIRVSPSLWGTILLMIIQKAI